MDAQVKNWRWFALVALLVTALAWGCSGEPGDGNGGSGGGANGPACPKSLQGCDDSGLGGSHNNGGASGIGASSGAAGSSEAGAGGLSGATSAGGSSAGSPADGAGSGGLSGSSGLGGQAGSSGAAGSSQGGAGGLSGSAGSSGSGGLGGTSGTSGSAGTDSGAGSGGLSGSSGLGGQAGSSGAAGSTQGGAGGLSGSAGSGADASAGTSGSSGSGGSAGIAGQDASSGGSGGLGGTSGTAGSAGQDSGAGGVSGQAGAGGLAGSGGSGGLPPKPFSCTGWTRDNTFPSGMDLTGDIWGSSASDVYVATGKYNTGEIAHYNGANWSLMTLPTITGTWYKMNAIWGSSANDVWAGGAKLENFFFKGVILRRVNQGAWQESRIFGITEPDVGSIWGADANNAFALVGYAPNASTKDIRVYRWNGSVWTSMTLPSHPANIMMRQIWGKNASDVYAVGTQLDAGSKPVKALLWRYDGNGAWQNIATLPADVVQLGGVHGAGNIQVVGQYWDGAKPHGVRLASTDLTSWSRYNSTVTSSDRAVWAPWQDACLMGGATPVPPINGAARLGTMSLGSWSPETLLDGIAAYVTGIAPVPNSSQVWLATYGETGFAGVYKGNCQ